MENVLNNWLVTGANGNLGSRLLSELTSCENTTVRAIVRSESAKNDVNAMLLTPGQRERLDVVVCDYTNQQALARAFQDYDKLVHLVGILKETRVSKYVEAHEMSCEAISGAAQEASISHIVYLSIVGSKPNSPNACLASKGKAEKILMKGAVSCCVLRVPMVLGENDYASRALYYRGRKGISFSFRASSLEQPIYAGDVLEAIRLVSEKNLLGSLDLAGPEVLSRRQLAYRSAALLNNVTRVVSLPIVVGQTAAWFLELVMSDPPITSAMLDVLDHDDNLDHRLAMNEIGLESLTPLDTMLERVFSVILDGA